MEGMGQEASSSVCPCCGERLGGRQQYCSGRCRAKASLDRRVEAARQHSLRVRQDSAAIRNQILGLISDGRWWTVWQLAEACRCMETTASAKLRDLRKKPYGGFAIESRRLPDSCAYEFRLVKHGQEG